MKILYRNIEMLRAFAVVSVLIYHYFPSILPSGFLGVDVFFLISGFVITHSLYQNRHQDVIHFIIYFYFRRIKRLLPVLLVAIFVSSIVVTIFVSDHYARMIIKTGIFSLIGASNFYLYNQEIDYWGGIADLNAFTHTWSLAVEEQYYLIYPILFITLYKIFKFKQKEILIILFGLTFISYILNILSNVYGYNIFSFYMMPIRFWELSIGCVCYFLSSQFLIKERIKSQPLIYMVIFLTSLIMLTYLMSVKSNPNFILLNISLIIICSFVISFLDIQNCYFEKLIYNNLVLYVAKISYSLYIWHWIILCLIKWSGHYVYNEVFALIISVIISILTYHFIELYFKETFFIKDTKKKLLYFLFIYMIAAVSLIIFEELLIKNIKQENVWKDIKMIHNDFDCHAPTWTKTPILDCLVPKNAKTRHIYIMGDSHSTNLLPSIIEVTKDSYEIRYLGDSNFGSSITNDRLECMSICPESEIYKRLEFIKNNVKQNDIVILAFSRDNFFRDSGDFKPYNHRLINREILNRFEIVLTEYSATVNKLGGELIIIAPLPKVCSHKDYEIGRMTNPSYPCEQIPSVLSLDDRLDIVNMYTSVSKEVGMTILDPHEYLCPNQVCSVLLDNKLWSWDGSPHFITTFPNPLAPFFSDYFRKRK